MEKISRRELLKGVAAAGGGVALLGTLQSTAQADAPSDAPTIVWVNAGPLGDMNVGDMKRIVLPDPAAKEVIYVRRASDKDYAAFSARCTHHGCVIGYDAARTTFTCPCHGAQFNDLGQVIKPPARRPLNALATKFDKDGNLWVSAPPPPPVHGEHHDGVTPPPSGAPAPPAPGV